MQQETCVYICACICMVYPKWYHRKGGGVGKAILYYGACLTQSHAQIIFTKIFCVQLPCIKSMATGIVCSAICCVLTESDPSQACGE